MLTDARPPAWPRPTPTLAAAVVGSLLLLVACSGGGSEDGATTTTDRRGPNAGPLPTLEGGLDLVATDPAAVLVAEGLSFGAPLPSEQRAADAFTEAPEVTSALARRVLVTADFRYLGQVVVVVLDGAEIFDEEVLDGFARGVVEATGGGPVEEVVVGAQPTFRSTGETTTAQGYLTGNLLVLVTAGAPADAGLVVERQVAARAAGLVGTLDPSTPMRPLPIEAAFVAVPTVTFQPIPAPEEEPPPPSPSLVGATGLQGRYGVVAGERRTVAWVFSLDAATYPTAEVLEPAMAALVSGRAGGTAASLTEVIDRVVLAADAAPGVEGALAARAFRHGALLVLVEGREAAQVDAVVADWITTLAGG